MGRLRQLSSCTLSMGYLRRKSTQQQRERDAAAAAAAAAAAVVAVAAAAAAAAAMLRRFPRCSPSSLSGPKVCWQERLTIELLPLATGAVRPADGGRSRAGGAASAATHTYRRCAPLRHNVDGDLDRQ